MPDASTSKPRAWLKTAALVGLIVAGAVGAAAQSTGPARPPAVVSPAAHTARIVAAADAFLGALSDAQKRSVRFAFNDARQRARWSNLPSGAFRRAGLRWGEMNPAQRAALTELLATVLSPQGMQMVKEQMDADDVLRGQSGGGPNFGSDYYYVAFLGEPSTSTPWMLQFGGHHLALNITVAGTRLTLSPSLTGGQPTRYMKDGRTIYIVEREVTQANALLGSLTPAQKRKAVLGGEPIDLVLGPGHDGQTLQPEGVAGAELSDAQKAQLLALIGARLGMLNADDLAAAMAPIRRNLNQTYFAWYGLPIDAGKAYFRVSGPTLVLEFSPQDLGGDHLHNIYRDPTNDYGSSWASLK